MPAAGTFIGWYTLLRLASIAGRPQYWHALAMVSFPHIWIAPVSRILVAVNSSVNRIYVNKFIAHAATPGSRADIKIPVTPYLIIGLSFACPEGLPPWGPPARGLRGMGPVGLPPSGPPARGLRGMGPVGGHVFHRRERQERRGNPFNQLTSQRVNQLTTRQPLVL